MSISGNLKTMPFPDLLQWVSQSRKTGTLMVDGPSFKKKLYFREGKVVASASNNPKEFLGYYLVGWNFVAEDELQELLDMQDRHGALLGELLVIVGRLSREELAGVLRVKTEESIFDMFLWMEADFRFLEAILPAKKFDPLNIDVDHLILEGVRRLDEWERSRKVISSDDCIPSVVGPLDVNSLSPEERGVLCEINGINSIEDIGLARRMGPFPVRQFVLQGLKVGVFKLKPPSGEARSIPGFSKSGWRTLLRTAEKALSNDNLLEAYRLLEDLRTKTDGNPDAQNQVNALQEKIEKVLTRSGFDDRSILEVAVPPEALTELPCSREEGFLLSRINGAYTIEQILSILPGSPLEHRLVIHGLMGRGIIRVTRAQPQQVESQE
jgi:hypothetical protein